MIPFPRFHRHFYLQIGLSLLLMVMPRDASAIRLFWSNGLSDLSITENARAMLIVRADSAEGVLPDAWKLIWTADSSGVQFAALDSLAACELDTARVSAIDLPASPADSAANEITAHFCSAGAAGATTAYYLADLVGGSKGKLKVIALDPVDSMSVRESNEVTYNGGVDGDYAPTVLRAVSDHQSLQLRVTAVGSGLNGANSMSIMASDSSWILPLTVTSRNDRSLVGVANVAALLPACQAAVGSQTGAASAATLPADEEPALEAPQSCGASYFENLLNPPPSPLGFTIQPKDFAFVRGFVDQTSHRYALHLFYIRHNYWYYQPPNDQSKWQPGLDEKNLGHIWTTDFNSWYGPGGLNLPDTVALSVRPGKFDEFHVWAPSIVQNGPFFKMFYTGVNNAGHQRIGVATSTDLITWTPADAPVLTSPQIPWASKNPPSPYNGVQQLRDPFVMEDPLEGDKWLMYFVAVDSIRSPKMAVGVATSDNLVDWTAFNDPFSSVERQTFQGATNVVESPHVFRRNGQWWMPYTVNGDQIFFETTTSADPTDTVATHWTNPIWMRGVTEGQPPELQYWHASEHLRINSTEYLAAFNDNAIAIDIKGVFAPANPTVDSLLLSCPELAGVGDREGPGGGVRMTVTRLRWGVPEVGLRLELPSRMAVRLALYDIAGRRRATLIDRELPEGVTDVAWDGRDQEGARVGSGMYFVRLSFAAGSRISKFVMIR